MQQAQQATRPQIAAALGLSLVSTNAAVAALEKEGVLNAGDLQASGGGRPVRVYHFNAKHGVVALITATAEAHCLLLNCTLLDLQGQQQEDKQARFARIHAESLDEWLDAAARRHTLLRISLPAGLGCGIAGHLRQRHRCPVQEYATAEALVSGKEDTLTLLLQKGHSPEGAMLRHGKVTPCLLLQHLPMLCNWETLNYEDHTLVEEMLARLLQLLACTIAPEHIDFHADFWNDRLISRLNFNLSTKLRGITNPPRLHFATLAQENLSKRLRQSVCKI